MSTHSIRLMNTESPSLVTSPSVPKLNDYVQWHTHTGLIEGWVYFSDPDHYCTIEVSTKPMTDAEMQHTNHRKHHVLVVCHKWDWHDIIKVGSRDSKYSNTIISDGTV